MKTAPLARCFILVTLLVAGCVAVPKSDDYSAFRAANPRSILVVPALNNSVAVEAPDFLLPTLSRPFAERGYYVFPAHMVKRLLEEDGLSDAGLVHGADASHFGRLFGCDSVLFVTIQRWDSRYVVLATTTTVEFEYVLRNCRTGETLWEHTRAMQYSPQSSSSGNLLVDVIAQAVTAAIERAAPNYLPLAQQANALAAATPGQGLPAGPYLAEQYGRDTSAFVGHCVAGAAKDC